MTSNRNQLLKLFKEYFFKEYFNASMQLVKEQYDSKVAMYEALDTEGKNLRRLLRETSTEKMRD